MPNKKVSGVPPAMRDRYIVRCVDQKFGPNSKDNPMVTLGFEVVGLKMADGSVSTEVTRGDTDYMVAGIKTQPSWFTLVGRGLEAFRDFQRNAGIPEIDDGDVGNVDVTPYNGLLISAILNNGTQIERKALTEEDIASGKREGDPILDDDGKPTTRGFIKIDSFGKRFTGELPSGGSAF